MILEIGHLYHFTTSDLADWETLGKFTGVHGGRGVHGGIHTEAYVFDRLAENRKEPVAGGQNAMMKTFAVFGASGVGKSSFNKSSAFPHEFKIFSSNMDRYELREVELADLPLYIGWDRVTEAYERLLKEQAL